MGACDQKDRALDSRSKGLKLNSYYWSISISISISISLTVIVGYYPVDWSSLSEVTSSVL